MSFQLATYPASVQAAFRQGPMAWALVVENCLRSGIYEPTRLTDIVFYLHHPERNGRPLLPSEITMIKQWKGFRALIMPKIAYYHHQYYTGHPEGTDVGGGW